MAWISGLADKAENILNKIDQNTANAIQVATSTTIHKDSGDAVETNALDAMRRSVSASKLSLKAALSPMKLKSSNTSQTMIISTKSDGEVLSLAVPPDSDGLHDPVEWNISAISSRRSSINSRSDVAIDVEEVKPSNKNYNSLKKVTTEASLNTSTAESQELMAFKIALNEVTCERDDLRARLTLMCREDEKIALLKHLEEMETLVQRLTDERDQAQMELRNIQSSNNTYMHTISELDASLAKLQQEYVETAHKLQIQQKETEQQRQELQAYRVKAQLALQMKDNLIAELKSESSTSEKPPTGKESESSLLLQMEFDALKEEHRQTQEECNTKHQQLEELRRDLQLISEQHASQMAAARAAEEELRRELRVERERLLATQSEQRMQAQELAKLRQQLSNQMASAATCLQEKDEQLQKLRAELMQRKSLIGGRTSDEGGVPDNLEERVKTLTQTLVDKQQTLEKVTSERNAIRIQFEKIQEQLQQQQYAFNSNSLQSSGRHVTRNALLCNTTDDVKAQFPLLMRENPFDNRVARRVKRAYSSLDSAGIRLGAFLRRYPLMRIFVLLYVGLLHLWVVFVLISSSPSQN